MLNARVMWLWSATPLAADASARAMPHASCHSARASRRCPAQAAGGRPKRALNARRIDSGSSPPRAPVRPARARAAPHQRPLTCPHQRGARAVRAPKFRAQLRRDRCGAAARPGVAPAPAPHRPGWRWQTAHRTAAPCARRQTRDVPTSSAEYSSFNSELSRPACASGAFRLHQQVLRPDLSCHW